MLLCSWEEKNKNCKAKCRSVASSASTRGTDIKLKRCAGTRKKKGNNEAKFQNTYGKERLQRFP